MQKVAVEGSFKPELPGIKQEIPGDQQIHPTIYLAADADDQAYDATAHFANEHHLAVLSIDKEKHSISLQGSVEDMQAAFGVQLHTANDPKTGKQIRARAGVISVPHSIAPHVVAVLGLDNRAVASPRFRWFHKGAQPEAQAVPLTAPQVAKAYQFPTDATGKGVAIAIIELGGGYTFPDLKAYFNGLNIPEPKITWESVLGAVNQPGSEADGEVLLDLEVAGAVAPGASYVVYFAPNTDQGFVEAILAVATDTKNRPQVLSISWGSAEDQWTPQAMKAMNMALEQCAAAGVSVFVAAGDDGAADSDTDGLLHVDFPGSSPFVTSCGGTKLILDAQGKIKSQTVWSEIAEGEGATGGGVSAFFPRPAFQEELNIPKTKTGFPGRGVPDITGCADPTTGFWVVVDGQRQAIGGSSAVAPLYAALTALIIEKRGGKSLGLLNTYLYKEPGSTFYDIRHGENESTIGGQGFSAGKGWDAASGLGSVIGTRLEKLLEAA